MKVLSQAVVLSLVISAVQITALPTPEADGRGDILRRSPSDISRRQTEICDQSLVLLRMEKAMQQKSIPTKFCRTAIDSVSSGPAPGHAHTYYLFIPLPCPISYAGISPRAHLLVSR
ncbi:hypothetical protein BJ322DRAFT_804430 [Thelephora terrestris]|uniref:Uncharacterized protein n=1 Tax=Thelephora terrestris TaxID=56493 RepID=A0A9P6L711_9AGAM|nr:hypothetical protein BJ322DRAFT_804430 [Thelephora terrestris]